MTTERSQVAEIDQWNVAALYPTYQSWEEEFKTANRQEKPKWPEFMACKGQLNKGAQVLKECLDQQFSISRQLSKLFTYAHLRHDEDIANDLYKQAYSQITSLLHSFNEETAWFEPELLGLSDETIQNYLNSPLLAEYQFHLEKIVRVKKHMLSVENEELMALAGKALQTAGKAFSAFNDADIKFGSVMDSQGKLRDLSHATYGLFIRDQDRLLRKNAFTQQHQKYLENENTLCELLNGQVQTHVFNAHARHYSSSLEAALFPKNIDTQVYHALIKAVHSKMSSLHQYVKLRKKLLGVDELHMYDMYVPLTPSMDIKIDFNEAVDLVIESVAPLGSEYQNALRKGLKEERWTDRYENKNKRSGAYSSGCFDSMPYILMNYKSIIRDAFTLAHEAGHSMHSLLSHTYQPYHQSDYPIFLAEVASTFNEELLMRLLVERASSAEEKIFLINQKVEDIRTTLFRQTMFAEFELKIHEMAEQHIPLTPKILKEIYYKLNEHYFGPSAIIDPEIAIEWARIPHFYYNFYVFQYATGISASLALSERVLRGNDAEREAYLSFLKGGSSQYPIDLLKSAGVDMLSPDPVQTAIVKFGDLVNQLEKLSSDEF
jgi:oligoendopeptidase F